MNNENFGAKNTNPIQNKQKQNQGANAKKTGYYNDYRAYSLQGSNYLYKGISMSSSANSTHTQGFQNSFDDSQVSQADLEQARRGKMSQQQAQLEQIHWVSADLVSYYKKHDINLRNNMLVSKSKCFNQAIASNDYKQTGELMSCITECY